MKRTKSTFLHSDKDHIDWMKGLCEIVLTHGGTFSVNTYCNDNWFVDFDVSWPDSLDPTKVMKKDEAV